jgi:hypothetical protein
MKTRAALLILLLFISGTYGEPTGKPQYGAWGFDTDGADLKTKPGTISSAMRMAPGSIASRSRRINRVTACGWP